MVGSSVAFSENSLFSRGSYFFRSVITSYRKGLVIENGKI